MSAEKKRSSFLRRFWRLAALLLFLGLLQILFDPFSLLVNAAEHARIRIELAQARARWNAAGIEDYDLTVTGSTALVCFVEERTFPVRDGQPPDISEGYWEYCTVPRSVPDGFALVERSLTWDGRVQVGFDEEYGYVNSFSYNCNFTHGLFSPIVSDCTQGFHVESFIPIAQP